MKAVRYSREASKTLESIPSNTARRIREKVAQYAADPASQSNNVKALKGAKGYLRLRVGDWRIIFTDDGAVVAIIRIGARGSVYE